MMARRSDANKERLLRELCSHHAARLIPGDDGSFVLNSEGPGRPAILGAETVASLASEGLITEVEPDRFAATEDALSWLQRRSNPEDPFRTQHAEIDKEHHADLDRTVLINLEESPIAALARRPAKDGKPWLSPDLVAAAERLRRDFEIGRLQPRVTANWSASVNSGRRTGNTGGVADLTDMALAARASVDRALEAVGGELAGLLVDVCCFLKGVETVERERQWPARSAKLVLRIGLQSLAKHYGLAPAATGKPGSRKVRHWGSDDFRPTIT
jgi:hypothetical protein